MSLDLPDAVTVLARSMWSAWSGTRWMSAGVVSSRPPAGTVVTSATRCTRPAAPCTGFDLLTEKQQHRLDRLFAVDVYVEVEVTWGVYQSMVAASREPDASRGRQLMQTLIPPSPKTVRDTLIELITLGRTLAFSSPDPSAGRASAVPWS